MAALVVVGLALRVGPARAIQPLARRCLGGVGQPGPRSRRSGPNGPHRAGARPAPLRALPHGDLHRHLGPGPAVGVRRGRPGAGLRRRRAPRGAGARRPGRGGAAARLARPRRLRHAGEAVQPRRRPALAVVAVAWRVLDAPRRRERWVALTLVSIGVTMASAAVAPYVAAAFLAGALAALRARGPALRWAATAAAAYGVFAAGWWLLFLRPVITPDLRSYWSDFYPALAPSSIAAAGVEGARRLQRAPRGGGRGSGRLRGRGGPAAAGDGRPARAPRWWWPSSSASWRRRPWAEGEPTSTSIPPSPCSSRWPSTSCPGPPAAAWVGWAGGCRRPGAGPPGHALLSPRGRPPARRRGRGPGRARRRGARVPGDPLGLRPLHRCAGGVRKGHRAPARLRPRHPVGLRPRPRPAPGRPGAVHARGASTPSPAGPRSG